jgi:hypothetical protein
MRGNRIEAAPLRQWKIVVSERPMREVLRRSSRSMLRKRDDPADYGDHVWVWLAEISPLHMRGLGIGISVFFGWTTHGILALFFPPLVKGIGITGSFFMFAVIGVAALVFVWTKVPEARGRSLEALEEDVTTGEIYIGLR